MHLGGEPGGADAGLCDEDGCDLNSWRQGDKTVYGPGLTADTKQPSTVLTQFSDPLVTKIHHKYVQGCKTIDNSKSNSLGINNGNAISDKFCEHQKMVFKDANDFKNKGGFAM
jgi:cellulose 1,4-beta-cellobiosidase